MARGGGPAAVQPPRGPGGRGGTPAPLGARRGEAGRRRRRPQAGRSPSLEGRPPARAGWLAPEAPGGQQSHSGAGESPFRAPGRPQGGARARTRRPPLPGPASGFRRMTQGGGATLIPPPPGGRGVAWRVTKTLPPLLGCGCGRPSSSSSSSCGVAQAKMAELDLLGSILSSMEPPPGRGGREARRAKEESARLKKLQEQEKRQKVEFRKQMETVVSAFIQDSSQSKKTFRPMNKVERSILHDVADVAGLTSFSFGEDEETRYVMVFKKEFAPSDEELEAYRRGEEWDPLQAEQKRRLKELAQKKAEAEAQKGPAVVNPTMDYKDKYSHLIGKVAAKDAAHTMEANKAYGCVPVANKRDTRSIEEAMNEIRAKKRLRQSEDEATALPSNNS